MTAPYHSLPFGNNNAAIVQQAIERAIAVRNKAYMPYSGFAVGCTLVDEKGVMVDGCNVENASYGLTICAERGAVMMATALGTRNIVLCVVATDTEKPVTPCGACRQVLYECSQTMLCLCVTTSGEQRWHLLHELLPHGFTL